jgi:hypothetical protein
MVNAFIVLAATNKNMSDLEDVGLAQGTFGARVTHWTFLVKLVLAHVGNANSFVVS